MIEATAQGQVVIAIDVEPIVRNLQADVTELSATREIEVRARGHVYRAVLTPDLEAGGYSSCGALSWAGAAGRLPDERPQIPAPIHQGDVHVRSVRLVPQQQRQAPGVQ